MRKINYSFTMNYIIYEGLSDFAKRNFISKSFVVEKAVMAFLKNGGEGLPLQKTKAKTKEDLEFEQSIADSL